jgi:hypothetical protein
MLMLEVDGGQMPFEIVHSRILVPTPKPVTAVTGESVFVIVPLPDVNCHAPEPTVGAFAVMIVFGPEIQRL